MQKVSPEQLRAMNAQRERCVIELGDAGVDAMLYACLVAIMSTGPGEHRNVELSIAEQLAAGGARAKVPVQRRRAGGDAGGHGRPPDRRRHAVPATPGGAGGGVPGAGGPRP